MQPSLPFLNLENVKHRKIQHSKSQNHYTPQIPNSDQNPYGTTLETHFHKQSKILSQIHGMLARQGQFDQQKHKVEMTQRIKELQYDRLIVHQELERQKSAKLQALTEISEEKKIIKKEKNGMKDIILDMIFRRAQKRKKTPLRDSEESTPSTVTLKHSNSERKASRQRQSNDIPTFHNQSQRSRVFRTNSNIVFNTAGHTSDLSDRNSILGLQQEETSTQLDLNPNPLSGSKNSIESVEEEGFESVKRSKVKKQRTKRYQKTKSLKNTKSAILEEDDYEIVSASKEQKK